MKKENYIRIQSRVGMSNHDFLDSIHGFYYGVAVALVLIILLASISSCSNNNDNNIKSGIGSEQIYPVGDQRGFKTTGIDPFLANYPDISQGPVTFYSVAGNLMTEFDHGKASEIKTSGYVADAFLRSRLIFLS